MRWPVELTDVEQDVVGPGEPVTGRAPVVGSSTEVRAHRLPRLLRDEVAELLEAQQVGARVDRSAGMSAGIGGEERHATSPHARLTGEGQAATQLDGSDVAGRRGVAAPVVPALGPRGASAGEVAAEPGRRQVRPVGGVPDEGAAARHVGSVPGVHAIPASSSSASVADW